MATKSKVIAYQARLFGRPEKIRAAAPVGKRTRVLTCRLTPSEYESVLESARKRGRPVSEHARAILVSVRSLKKSS